MPSPPPDSRYRLVHIGARQFCAPLDDPAANDCLELCLKYRRFTKTIEYGDMEACEFLPVEDWQTKDIARIPDEVIPVNTEPEGEVVNAELYSADTSNLTKYWMSHPVLRALRVKGLLRIRKFYTHRGVLYLVEDEDKFVIYDQGQQFKAGIGLSFSNPYLKASGYTPEKLDTMRVPRKNRLASGFSKITRGQKLQEIEWHPHRPPSIIFVSETPGGQLITYREHANSPYVIFSSTDGLSWRKNNSLAFLQYGAVSLVPVTGTLDILSFPLRSIAFENIIGFIPCIFGGCVFPG